MNLSAVRSAMVTMAVRVSPPPADDGKSYTLPRPGQLPDDVELLRPELPTQAEWTEALNRAGELFGVAIGGRSLGARNLSLFADTLKAKLKDVADAAELPAAA